MSFLHPSFLFALTAIAIPILVHLFNFRKFKTIYFSNVKFLKEVQQETQAKSKLKHILVLILRILTICFLVFAFAQPYIPLNENASYSKKAVSIFIDNSQSMEAINKEGNLLDIAKKRALEIVSSYSSKDQFQLLTNDFESKHQHFVDKKEFEKLLDEVKISSQSKTLSTIFTRQLDLLNNLNTNEKVKKVAFILSDFQKNSFDLGNTPRDSSTTFNFIKLESNQHQNIYIDTCWFETPIRQNNTNEKLHVIIKNNSNKRVDNNSIKLFINNVQKTPGSYSIEENAETEITIPFLSKKSGISPNDGIMNCRLEIKDHPITFDDSFYFSYYIAKEIKILCINGTEKNNNSKENKYLSKLYSNDSLFIFENAQQNNLDYSSIANYEVVIINEIQNINSGLSIELEKFITNGGNLVIIPHETIDFNSYKLFLEKLNINHFTQLDSLKTKVEKVNIQNALYRNVFDNFPKEESSLNLPTVLKHYKISKNNKNSREDLLTLQNSEPLLSSFNSNKGKVYLLTVALQNEFSNLPQHFIFVPTFYNIGIYSQNPQPLFYTIGNSSLIKTKALSGTKNVYHIKSLNTNFDIIPETKILNSSTEIHPRDQIKESGNFLLYSDKKIEGGLSFNYNRSESELSFLSKDELLIEINKYKSLKINVLSENKNTLKEQILATEKGQTFWKACLLLSLLFLSLEVILLRFMKG